MKKGLFRKGFVFGIIVLFIGAGLSLVVTAVENNIKNSDESIDSSNDSGASDDYKEIITLIGGTCRINSVKRLGLFLREVNISPYYLLGGGYIISLNGLRRSNGRVEIYEEYANVGYVNVSRFRGLILQKKVGYFIIGIAFGDIEYKLYYIP